MLLAVGAGLVWLLGRDAGSSNRDASSPTLSIRRLTSSGTVIIAAISPDGKYAAYVQSYRGKQSLHLRQIGSSQSLELLPPRGGASYWGMTFTPDSRDIVFGQVSNEFPTGAFYRISALGGVPRKLLETMDSAPSFSPDGSRFAFLRRSFPSSSESAVMIADADGSNIRTLVVHQAPEVLSPRFFAAPSWSPDGSLVAASVMNEGAGRGNVRAYDAETGAAVWESEQTWPYVSGVAWSPQGDAVAAIARPDDRPTNEIWWVPYPTGAARQVTSDPFEYRLINFSGDGESMLAVGNTFESSIWVHPVGGGSPRRISGSLMAGRYGFDFTLDGRLVFQTIEGDRMELALMNLDGSGRQVLTDNPEFETYPRVAASGEILYSVGRSRSDEIRVRSLEGANYRVLSNVEGSYIGAGLAPDGLWAVVPRSDGLWRVPVDGSEPDSTDRFSGIPAGGLPRRQAHRPLLQRHQFAGERSQNRYLGTRER